MMLKAAQIRLFFLNEKTQIYANCLFAFSFGLGTFLNSVGLIIFLTASVLSIFYAKKRVAENKTVLLFTAPYFIYILSLTYAYEPMDGLAFLVKSLPILVVPFLFGMNQPSEKLIKMVKHYFFKGMAVSVLLLFIFSLYKIVVHGLAISDLRYYELAETLSFHPTYYSMYLIVACVFVSEPSRSMRNVTRFGYLVLFALAIVLLQTRMAYLLLFLIVILRMTQFKGLKFRTITGLMAFLILSISVLLPGNLDRMKETVSIDTKKLVGDTNENGISQRFWLWSKAIEHIKEKPFFGYGLRSQRSYFHKKTHKEMLASSLTHSEMTAYMGNAKKNLHNQYLQITYDAGLFGLFIFLLGVYAVFRHTPNQGLGTFVIVYAIFLIFLFSENILDRQHGIHFYAFILPLLFSTTDVK